MNVWSRGIKNAFRNSVRTFSIVVILGLSMGLALTMLIGRQAVSQKVASVKSSIGNTITVTPAGTQGFEGGGNPLTTDQANSLKLVSHVTAVNATLADRLTSTDTSLQSAVEAGSLGQRFAANNGVGFQGPADRFSTNSSGVTRTFTPPVRVSGISDVSMASVYGGSSVRFTSGQAFDPTKDEDVAVIGSALASKNNLNVGSTFTAYGTAIKVVGIYDTGTQFANNGVVMPLTTLQRLSNQPNAITAAVVTVDSVDNLNGTVSAIKAKLGSSADVVSSQQAAETAVAPLESVKTIATYSSIAALVAGAVVVLLTMIMIVRERRREIGVMKAIGSSNSKTMLQFVIESTTLTLIGLVIGIGIAVAAATPITNTLVRTSASNAQAYQQSGTSFRRGFGPSSGLRLIAGQSLRTVRASASWQTLVEGVVGAFAIAVVGSAVPAYLISRIRPSEVMRTE